MTELPPEPIPGQMELPLDPDPWNDWVEEDDCDCHDCKAWRGDCE